MADKFIEIKRYYGLIEEAQSDESVQTWLGESYRAIGPYFQNKAVATGLSFEEQKMLLPEYFGIEASDRDFRKKVEEKYHEFTTAVPKGGVKLNIGLADNEKPLSVDNKPELLKDYLSYRHLVGNQEVAMDEMEAKRNPLKKFYIVDPEKVSDSAISNSKLEDKALELYFNNKDNELKANQILTLMGASKVYDMKPEEKKIKLKSYAVKQAGMNEYQQKEVYKKFIDVCEDKDLEVKFLIQELVGAQVLEKVGSNILLKETGEKLGDNVKDAVLFLKNAKNTRMLNKLHAEYNTKIRKGAFKSEEEIVKAV